MTTVPSSAMSRPTPIAKGFPGAAETNTSSTTTAAPHDELVLTNQLDKSRSPYVRAHAGNPVAWQLWSPETLALAKKHNRVLFVSIGYAACHWCHVMERESFENEEIAKILNENFIPIKIDREERPDIDRIYMNFVQATTGSGGWPLNVFLTPDLEPVFGGTYWRGPNGVAATNDQLGFLEVLEKIVQTWKEQRSKFLASAKEILPRLKEFTDEGLKGNAGEQAEHLEVDLLEEAYSQFVTRYDPVHGGFGLPPKFPVPSKLAFLLRLGTFPATVRDIVGERECENAKQMVVTTLTNMARGGIHDQIGHGFHRYSVTADWSLPHFEKMLYDNAQLLAVYLDAWLVTRSPLLLTTAISTATYLCTSSLAHPAGGFYSSEGADSLYRRTDTDKREGAFYVFTRRELDTILPPTDASICAKYWNVHRDGNVNPEDDSHDEFIHQNVLRVAHTSEQLAGMHGLPVEKIDSIIAASRTKLLAHRNAERPRPNLDDKIITAWNGLAISALSRAASILHAEAPDVAKMCREHAIRTAAFVKANLFDPATGTLKRVWRQGPGETPGFADDYAYLISGLLHLYEATFDDSYLQWAETLQRTQLTHFWDSNAGGFFSTPEHAADMILRLKDGLDSQEPSTNGISAVNLFRLSTILGDGAYAQKAKDTTAAFSAEVLEHPAMFASMMAPIVAANLGMRSIVLVGADADAVELKQIRGRLLTNTTVVVLSGKEQWLLSRNELYKESVKANGGKKKVQVCEGTVCLDAFDLAGLEKALEEMG